MANSSVCSTSKSGLRPTATRGSKDSTPLATFADTRLRERDRARQTLLICETPRPHPQVSRLSSALTPTSVPRKRSTMTPLVSMMITVGGSSTLYSEMMTSFTSSTLGYGTP